MKELKQLKKEFLELRKGLFSIYDLDIEKDYDELDEEQRKDYLKEIKKVYNEFDSKLKNLLDDFNKTREKLENDEEFDKLVGQEYSDLEVISNNFDRISELNSEYIIDDYRKYVKEIIYIADALDFRETSKAIISIQKVYKHEMGNVGLINKIKKTLKKYKLVKNDQGKRIFIRKDLLDDYVKACNRRTKLIDKLENEKIYIFEGIPALFKKREKENLDQENNDELVEEKENSKPIEETKNTETKTEKKSSKHAGKEDNNTNDYVGKHAMINDFEISQEHFMELIRKLETIEKTKSSEMVSVNAYGRTVTIPANLESEYLTLCNNIVYLQNKLYNKSSEPKDLALVKNEKDIVPVKKEKEIIPVEDEEFIPEEKSKNSKKKKVRFRDRIKKHFKKIIAGAAAVLVLLTSAVGLSKCKKDEKIESNPSISDTQVTKPKSKDSVIEKNSDNYQNEKNKSKNNKKTNTKKANDNDMFSSTYTVSENASIYDNAYDAYNKKNKQNPYYSSSKERDIMGVVINYNNKIISFVELLDDSDTYEVSGLGEKLYLTKQEAEQQINELLNKGGKVSEYLFGEHNNEYEGFYNKSDVKVKVR